MAYEEVTTPIIFSNDVAAGIDNVICSLSPAPDQVFVVADRNTSKFVARSLMADARSLQASHFIEIEPGEGSKSIDGAAMIWSRLLDAGATRNSLVVNVGGGVVCDLGGFVASTYMRGVRTLNIPTSLLAAVDASVGGKTAVNFGDVKNIVGTFSQPVAVIVSTRFFATLPRREVLSGWGEMIKHALLDGSSHLAALVDFDPATPFDSPEWLSAVKRSVEVKRRVVDADFREAGIRKALNLGHTVAHAIESVGWHRCGHGVPHGHAVAWGLLVDMVLSRMAYGDQLSAVLYAMARSVKELYGPFPIACRYNAELIAAMGHDKKNRSAGEINFTLLKQIGEPIVDCSVAEADILAAIDIVRDLTS